jgi:hypothetical protein
MPVSAVYHVRRMCGGAQSHELLCDDDRSYVVKFKNNPQHKRILANEMIATRLAEKIGLPVASAEIIEVEEEFAAACPHLTIQLDDRTVRCEAGLSFGSRFIHAYAGPLRTLTAAQLADVSNLKSFVGMLAFDKWVGNTDRREALFWRASDTGRYTATFVDQGHCFNGGAWNFPDAPRQGAYDCELVYLDVNGWHCFEPWLTRIETISDDAVWACAQDVPPEWYDGNDLELEMLIHTLLRRREQVRELICSFHKSSSVPFPAWSSPVPVPGRKVAQTGAAN